MLVMFVSIVIVLIVILDRWVWYDPWTPVLFDSGITHTCDNGMGVFKYGTGIAMIVIMMIGVVIIMLVMIGRKRAKRNSI